VFKQNTLHYLLYCRHCRYEFP